MNKLKRESLQDRQLVFLLVRMGLGLAFITAAWPKIMDPAGFAKILYGYDLFPGVSINLMALWVPWVELLAGLCLLTGIWAGSGLVVINTLLISFIAMISFNLARGHSFDCGCFSVGGGSQTSDAVWLLVRDVFMLGAGLLVARFYSRSGSGTS